ncbi:transcription factor EMB1444 isoform X2 [Curcuma longa]|uniref:transcription factor EMB1444 isoform X2 n=1 Tax=Curcuma longa TaxID=136217 RepID=UPI003D9E4D7E
MRNSSELRQLLRRLCQNTRWDYAVFWKLEQDKMILTWEDGYFNEEKEKQRLDEKHSFESSYINHRVISFATSMNAEDQRFASNPVKLALADMKRHKYSLGQGFVGEAARSQQHCWLFFSASKSKIQPDIFKDWQLQLAAKMKTVLLVPVDHYGVVQLGSLETVVEDSEFVLHIRSSFYTFYHGLGPHEFIDSGINCSPLLSPTIVPLLGNGSTSNFGSFNTDQSQQLLTMDHNMLSIFLVDHDSSQNLMDHMLGTDAILDTDEYSVMERCNSVWSSSIEGAQFGNHPNTINEGEMSEFTITENEQKIESMFQGSHNEPELHKALGMTYVEDYNNCFSNTTLGSSVAISKSGASEYHDYIFDDASACFVTESETDLLDAVVSSLQLCPDDSSIEEKLFRSLGNDCLELFDSCLTENKCESSVLDLGSFLPTNQQGSPSLSKAEGFINSPTNSCKSFCMSTTEDQINHKTKVHNGRKLPVSNKRGARNGSNYKQRPRDRQLIQDRVKELRGLIPNGSKCSIDTLLERTVSHMLFLESISSHAEKLKQNSHEVKREVKSSAKPGTETSGPKKACEQGSEQEIWPVVVEYLNQPGQILVEVLCNDYGLFLEIANIIRHLELTILKGVLESRSNELWAHFVLEVSRGFHRMHILWPLMQLLQRNIPVPRKL